MWRCRQLTAETALAVGWTAALAYETEGATTSTPSDFVAWNHGSAFIIPPSPDPFRQSRYLLLHELALGLFSFVQNKGGHHVALLRNRSAPAFSFGRLRSLSRRTTRSKRI